MIARAIRALRSARWAVAELVALASMGIISFLIPQEPILPAEQFAMWRADVPGLASFAATFGLDHIFQAVGFYVLVALTITSLVLCTVERVRVRRIRLTSMPSSPPGDATVITATMATAMDRYGRHLRGWKLHSGDGSAVFRRGGWGFLGSVVLHVALIVIAVGGLVSGMTTFTGRMVLTEGQRLADEPDSYVEVTSLPRFGSGFGRFEVGLERLDFTYDQGVITDVVAHMVATGADGTETSRDVRVNYPLRVDGKSFRPLDSGYSVQLVVRDPDGGTTFDSFVNLGNRAAEGWYDSATAGALTVEMLAVPDAAAELGVDAVDMLDMRDPAVWVTPVLDGVTGEMQLLRPGEFVQLPSGHEVAVMDIRRWNRFLVRADGGLGIIYAGFILALLGAAVRFLDPDRYVAVLEGEDGTVSVWSRQRLGRTAPTDLAARIAAETRSDDSEAS